MQKKSNHIIKWAVLCLALSSCSNVTNHSDKTVAKDEKDTIPPIENIKIPPYEYDWENTTFIDAFNAGIVTDLHDYVEKAPHITDTTIINKNNYNKRLCAGLYLLKDDKVHLKYFIPDTTDCPPNIASRILALVRNWNAKEIMMANKAHEYHHRYITKKKVFETNLSAEDYAKVCGHNEIAAYTTTLLYEREVVKRAIQCGRPAKEWRKLVSARFGAYWDAVEKGNVNLINPFLNDEKKDNYLIIKTVSDWWLKNEYGVNVYITKQKLGTYLRENKWAAHYPRNAKNYQKVLNDCYTFIKDGKLVNLNIFYKGDLTISTGLDDLPAGITYQDFDNQSEVKEMIATARAEPGSLLYVPKKTVKFVKKSKTR